MAVDGRPNVLVVLTDQQRWDTIGGLSNDDIQTPTLTGLAEESTWYPQAFCSHPVCVPSRSSLLSGLYMHQHGCTSNASTLPAGLPTFPRLLRERGYRTRAVGKMHFTPTRLDVGFDGLVLAEQDGNGRLEDDYHRELREAGLIDATDLTDQCAEFRRTASTRYWDSFGAIPTGLPEEWYSTSWIGDRAVEELRTWGPEGNLMMVGFIKPHHPFDAPARWAEQYSADELQVPAGWTNTISEQDRGELPDFFPVAEMDEGRLRAVIAQYYGSISQIDFELGRMLAVLRESKVYDNTMIVVTSDHGEYLGFHHLLLKNGLPYDPLIRVPLLVKFPGQQHAVREMDRLVSLVDIAPTIVAQAGAEVPESMAGTDLRASPDSRELIFVHGLPGVYVVRSRRHLAVIREDPRHDLLFDLESDPDQLDNLVHRESTQPFRDALARWLLFETPLPLSAGGPIPVVGGVPGPAPEQMLDYFRLRMA